MFLSMMGLQSASVLPKVGSILLFKDLIVYGGSVLPKGGSACPKGEHVRLKGEDMLTGGSASFKGGSFCLKKFPVAGTMSIH